MGWGFGSFWVQKFGGVRDFILFESCWIELGNPLRGVGLGDCDAFDPVTYHYFLLTRLTTLGRIRDLQYPLPATWEVVAQDLGMKKVVITNDLVRESPGYMDDQTRLFGKTRYHLFGRTYDDIAALRLVAKKYDFETDRGVVSELVKCAGAVTRAFGSAAMAVMNGSNFNAKVPSFVLISLLCTLI